MSKKCELQDEQYRKLLQNLWGKSWKYSGSFNPAWVPTGDFFYYMKALMNHIEMLEKRIEDLENDRSKI